MAKDEAMAQDGEIIDVLPNGHYKVKLHGMDFEVEAYKGGKMKKHRIKLLPGDWVQVEVNEYDISKGRIVYRYRSNPHATEQPTSYTSSPRGRSTRPGARPYPKPPYPRPQTNNKPPQQTK